MNLLECLNEKIQIIGGTPCDGGEDIVRELAKTSPILLPEDYIDFLKTISGNTDDGNVGLYLLHANLFGTTGIKNATRIRRNIFLH